MTYSEDKVINNIYQPTDSEQVAMNMFSSWDTNPDVVMIACKAAIKLLLSQRGSKAGALTAEELKEIDERLPRDKKDFLRQAFAYIICEFYGYSPSEWRTTQVEQNVPWHLYEYVSNYGRIDEAIAKSTKSWENMENATNLPDWKQGWAKVKEITGS